ncbi:MAG: hypothetical protein ACLPTF_18035 [Steroidobacteraceae bacterium]
MKKMLAIFFGDEKAAYEGVQTLSALDREGSIDVNLIADSTLKSRAMDQFEYGVPAAYRRNF